MNTENDLIQRLMVSKKIMDKHGEIKRGDARPTTPIVENFDVSQGTYNIPQELLGENQTQKDYHDPTKPLERERILKSKLPDEIKQLMYEHPIVQPNTIGGGSVLSDETIEKAQRLMGKNKITDFPTNIKSDVVIEETQKTHTSSNINIGEIRNMIRDVVRDTVRDVIREELKEAGMIVESTTNTNENIQFKIGTTMFMGKISKVKKMEK
jgi:hypothetical protein